MKDLVSIIMLSYNGVTYIKEAIDSIKAQTYPNWELIISDDGSNDGTYELSLALAKDEPRIKVVQTPERLGIPKNRKFAFSHTTGNKICHVDGDDALFPHSIEYMLKGMKDFDLAFSDLAWMDKNSNIFQYHANVDTELKNLGWRHLSMYTRKAYENTNGYNDNLISACEDGDLFMQIAEKYKYVRVQHALYKYRMHDNNASFNNKKCETCTEKPICNYIRVWGKENNWDPINWVPKTPLNLFVSGVKNNHD